MITIMTAIDDQILRILVSFLAALVSFQYLISYTGVPRPTERRS
jgi:hypothetical protein